MNLSRLFSAVLGVFQEQDTAPKTIAPDVVARQLEFLQAEADAIAAQYSWPNGKVPRFIVGYDPDETGARINLQTRRIMVAPKHILLPLAYSRFILGHEIAHYQQKVCNFKPNPLQVIFHKKSALAALIAGISSIAYFGHQALLASPNIINSAITIVFIILGGLITSKLFVKLVRSSFSQIMEADADKRAVCLLQDIQPAIDYFTISDHARQKMHMRKPKAFAQLVDVTHKTKNLLRHCEETLFSTHPTDKARIRILTSLKNKSKIRSSVKKLTKKQVAQWAQQLY